MASLCLLGECLTDLGVCLYTSIERLRSNYAGDQCFQCFGRPSSLYDVSAAISVGKAPSPKHQAVSAVSDINAWPLGLMITHVVVSGLRAFAGCNDVDLTMLRKTAATSQLEFGHSFIRLKTHCIISFRYDLAKVDR
jgi:hypothetical protein